MIAPIPFFEDRGSPIRVYEEAKALTKMGNKVDIICYHLGRNVKYINNIYRIINIPWYNKTSAGPSYHKLYLDVLLLLKTLKILKHNKYDIIHAHLHEGAIIAEILKRIFKLKIPIIFDAHGSLTLEMEAYHFTKNTSIIRKFWRLIEKKINEGSDYIFSSSFHLMEIMINDFFISKDKIKFVPDGVDTNFFDPNKFLMNEIKKKYNIMDDDIIIYTGIFSEQQGIDFLIEKVIPIVINNYKNVKFLLVGYPIDEYIEIAKKVKVKKSIIFTGKQRYEEIPKYLAAANIAIAPKYLNKGEANLKILTYMAMGLPTVAFDYQYNNDILKDTGITTNPDNADEFAKAILTLLNITNKTKLMGQKARIISKNEYSWISIANEIEKIYSFLINKI